MYESSNNKQDAIEFLLANNAKTKRPDNIGRNYELATVCLLTGTTDVRGQAQASCCHINVWDILDYFADKDECVGFWNSVSSAVMPEGEVVDVVIKNSQERFADVIRYGDSVYDYNAWLCQKPCEERTVVFPVKEVLYWVKVNLPKKTS